MSILSKSHNLSDICVENKSSSKNVIQKSEINI